MSDNNHENKNKYTVDMRGRFRASGSKSQNTSKPSGNIGTIWAEQEKLEKEELLLQKQAKEKKTQLNKERKQKISNATSKITKSTKEVSKSGFARIKSNKKAVVGAALVAVLMVGVFSFSTFNNSEDSTDILGQSTTADLPIVDDLPRENPDFRLLFPNGTDASNYDVVRISPPDADASYTYLDRFTDEGQIFKVTQQEVPDNFDLPGTATDFQATNIIQVDENIIYHGYSEKGGIQSVLFLKEGKLVSIRSPQRFADDQWANYFISLQ